LESLSLLSSTITVYCGLFYVSDGTLKKEVMCKYSTITERIVTMNDESKRFLFTLIVVSHLVFIAYWVFLFLQEMRTNIRMRFPQIYLSLFLCCRKSQL
jgi:hypothetical protein